jgi:Right handed beta helix region
LACAVLADGHDFSFSARPDQLIRSADRIKSFARGIFSVVNKCPSKNLERAEHFWNGQGRIIQPFDKFMKSNRLSMFTAFVALAAMFCLNSTAQAQATRTWVSGVGDDANPCSRTAPGKTFAGAISKTAAHGEIDALDPGGFGSVTITKSITIDGGGNLASDLNSGVNGIVVNAGASDVVTLRNIGINGAGTGLDGVKILAGKVVRLENCVIFGGSSGGLYHGVDFIPNTANAQLVVDHCRIYDFGGGAGIYASPTGTNATIVVENSSIEQCGTGIEAAAGTVTLSKSTVADNSGAGLMPTNSGSILTYHNNRIFNNNPDGNATGSLPLR